MVWGAGADGPRLSAQPVQGRATQHRRQKNRPDAAPVTSSHDINIAITSDGKRRYASTCSQLRPHHHVRHDIFPMLCPLLLAAYDWPPMTGRRWPRGTGRATLTGRRSLAADACGY